jgi:putative Mg2+ transporter-C (MgtC) family protein
MPQALEPFVGPDLAETALRLTVATVVGALLGLDREVRGHAAGLRTHGLVALSSAVITVSALMLFEQLRSEEAQPDPLRAIQGLAQAIGFIAAGLIFVRGGDVRNLTSAANIWLATAIGIACGAGQYGLVAIASLLGFLLLVVMRKVDALLARRGGHAGEPDEDEPAAAARQDPCDP